MPGDDDMKKRYMIAGAVAGAAAIACAVIGIRSWLQEKNAGSGYEEVREEVKDNTRGENGAGRNRTVRGNPDRFQVASGEKSGCIRLDHRAGNADRLSDPAEPR